MNRSRSRAELFLHQNGNKRKRYGLVFINTGQQFQRETETERVKMTSFVFQ
jgi:hypothetical protein